MKRLWEFPLIRILIVILLAVLVFQTATLINQAITPLMPDNIAQNSNSMSAIFKTILALMSIIIIALISHGNIKDFGLCRPKPLNYLKLILITFVVSITSLFILASLFMGFLSNLFQIEMSGGFNFGSSIWITILGIWFWSSITEEIFNRGLLQSLLQDLSKHIFLGLSLPVWISAILFGAGHLTLFNVTNSPFFVMFIVSNATFMGLIAAYYREKSGSIIPAVIVHILANVFGSLPRILMS